MSKLYSYRGAYPYPLPSDMSKYDINDFMLAPEKPQVPADKKLGWNRTNWVLEDYSEAETQIKWQEIRNLRNNLLTNSDIYIIRSTEDGTEITQEWKDYRQALRNVTTQESPFLIVWPTQPQ